MMFLAVNTLPMYLTLDVELFTPIIYSLALAFRPRDSVFRKREREQPSEKKMGENKGNRTRESENSRRS